MMEIDPHMETDLIITKKDKGTLQVPDAKSELLENKNRLITMITQDYDSKKSD
jgi:hypothetical protein